MGSFVNIYIYFVMDNIQLLCSAFFNSCPSYDSITVINLAKSKCYSRCIQSPSNYFNFYCRLGTLGHRLDFHVITNQFFFSVISFFAHTVISVILLENSLKEASIGWELENNDPIWYTGGSLLINMQHNEWLVKLMIILPHLLLYS